MMPLSLQSLNAGGCKRIAEAKTLRCQSKVIHTSAFGDTHLSSSLIFLRYVLALIL